jgi:hypothetical protein
VLYEVAPCGARCDDEQHQGGYVCLVVHVLIYAPRHTGIEFFFARAG